MFPSIISLGNVFKWCTGLIMNSFVPYIYNNTQSFFWYEVLSCADTPRQGISYTAHPTTLERYSRILQPCKWPSVGYKGKRNVVFCCVWHMQLPLTSAWMIEWVCCIASKHWLTKYKFWPAMEYRDVFLNENFSFLSEFASLPRLQMFQCFLYHDVFIQKSQTSSGILVGGYFII